MKLLWVTAYKHLGRDFELYMEKFERIKHLDLVCFADEPHATLIKERTSTRVLPYDEQDTFFPKYLERQKEIMNSTDFRKIRPFPVDLWFAFESAEYGIVNFSKTCMVRRACELFPEYTHYGWIDFGYAKDPKDTPPLILSSEKIIIGSCRDLFFNEQGEPMYGAFASQDRSLATVYNWNNPTLVFKHFHFLIQGNLFIVPKNLTHWLESKMDWSIQRHHGLGIVNHDEPFFLPIIHDFRSMFHIHVKEKWTDGFESHGTFIISKKAGRLIFQDYGCDSQRNSSTLWCIQEADKLYKWKDFESVRIMTNDFGPNDGTLCFSNESLVGLVPDWTFHKWDARKENDCDYDELVHRIAEAGRSNYEVFKVGWIGQESHPHRRVLVDIARMHPDIMECECMYWGHDWHSPSRFVPMDELVRKYAVLLDIEGYGYSARLKHLLWSHRPVILVDRPHKEFYYERLVPWKHYIPVKRDMSDLVEKVTWVLHNYTEAQRIAERAYEFSQCYLTRDACYARWNHILGTDKLLWVTAYKDIGRSEWSFTQRPFGKYIEAFKRIQHLNPVCFIDEPWATMVREQTGHTRILPLKVEDTFIQKYIERQTEILADPVFRKRIPEVLQYNPEFHYPEYGLVNCAKTCFVRRASEIFPEYTHYSWIDFGFAKTDEETPPHFRCDSLIDEDKILISSFRNMGFDKDGEPALGPYSIPSEDTSHRYNWNNPLNCLVYPPHMIQGNHWVVPKKLTHWLEQKMERSIQRNHDLGIVRHDESFFLPIIHDFRSRFFIHVKTWSDVTWISTTKSSA